VVQDVSAGAVVYHKEYATVVVSATNVVTIVEPASNSTQSSLLFPLAAYAVSATPASIILKFGIIQPDKSWKIRLKARQ
jgi:hypothetical protein